jgi:hypothetical protein
MRRSRITRLNYRLTALPLPVRATNDREAGASHDSRRRTAGRALEVARCVRGGSRHCTIVAPCWFMMRSHEEVARLHF